MRELLLHVAFAARSNALSGCQLACLPHQSCLPIYVACAASPPYIILVIVILFACCCNVFCCCNFFCFTFVSFRVVYAFLLFLLALLSVCLPYFAAFLCYLLLLCPIVTFSIHIHMYCAVMYFIIGIFSIYSIHFEFVHSFMNWLHDKWMNEWISEWVSEWMKFVAISLV